MDKAQKTVALVNLLNGSSYKDAYRVGKDDRTYENDGKYIKFADVSVGQDFKGFSVVKIPNPANDFDTQLEGMMDIYSSEQIVKGCLKSITIEQQSTARKLATGDVKMSQVESDARFNKLDTDTIGRLKTMEHIRAHIQAEWESEQTNDTEGLRLF